MTASRETAAPPPVRTERDGSGGAPQAPPRRRRAMRPSVLGGIAALTVVIVVAVWLFLRGGGDDTPAAGDATVATTTAEVETRDLVETESFDGTLGYAGSRNVLFTGPGVAAQNGSDSQTNAAYSPSESQRIAVAYEQTDPAETGTSTGELPVIEGPTDPNAPTTDTPATTSTETTPAETTPPETAPAETSPPETAPPATAPSEPSSSAPDSSGDSSSASDADASRATPSASAVPTAASGSDASASAQSAADQDAQTGGDGASATVTWLPDEGEVLERGEVVFRANGKATLLLYGEIPAWRTLRRGMKGSDVRQLEQNLVAMGYGKKSVTIDNRFGAATTRAVKEWQRDLVIDDTGVVKLGMVTFLPGERRVESTEVTLGDQIQTGQTVLTTSSIRQHVTVELDATDQDLLAVGDEVAIELPDGSEIGGTVDDIGTVATSSDSESDADVADAQQSDTSSATVPVTIALDEASGVELDEAPVDVEIESASAENVLAVPVTALVALLGGGFAVEVVDDSEQSRLVRVDPGIYADGYVEIEGDGIEPGMAVVVPA